MAQTTWVNEREEMGVLIERFSRYLLDENGHEYGDASEPGTPPALFALSDALTIQNFVDESVSAMVADAREQGASWTQVGEALGITRQAAWERFA